MQASVWLHAPLRRSAEQDGHSRNLSAEWLLSNASATLKVHRMGASWMDERWMALSALRPPQMSRSPEHSGERACLAKSSPCSAWVTSTDRAILTAAR